MFVWCLCLFVCLFVVVFLFFFIVEGEYSLFYNIKNEKNEKINIYIYIFMDIRE